MIGIAGTSLDVPGGATGRDNIVGGSTLDWTPMDATVFWLKDDFVLGSVSNGTIGELNWNANTITASPTVLQLAGVVPNLGILRGTTAAAAAGDGVSFSLNASTVGPLGNLAATAFWDCKYIFRILQTTTTRFRIGFATGLAANVVEPTDGIWLRFDTSAGFADANFRIVCRKASTDTNVDTTIVADTAWHKIRIRSDVAGTIKFTLDSGSDLTISTNVPTVALTPFICIVTDTTAAKTADADFFAFKMRGLAR